MEFMLLGGLAILAFGFFCASNDTKKKAKKNIDEDKTLNSFFNYINNIFLIKLNNYEWISVQEIIDINSKYKELYFNCKKKNKNEKFVELYEKYFTNNGEEIQIEEQVLKINDRYIQKELNNNKKLFDNIDGKSLDKQQRMAAIIDDNKLIVAGAGSGKTLTVAGTVKYLVESKKINPEDILLITYTKKAAEEMKERIVEKLNINVDVFTFHALGNKIIKETEPIKLTVLQDEYNKKFFKFIRKYDDFLLKIVQYNMNYKKRNMEANAFIESMMNDNIKYREIIKEKNKEKELTEEEKRIIETVEKRNFKFKDKNFKDLELIMYSNEIEDRYARKDTKTLKDFFRKKFYNNKEDKMYEQVQCLKEKGEDYSNLLKKIEENKKEMKTFNYEKVKSNEEILIANYLFRNNIKYEYEYPYKYNTADEKYRQYRPDFYLPEYDIYIEHFGINKNGKTPQYSPEEEKIYLEGVEWKRKFHKLKGTKLIESYSYEFSDGLFPENLYKKLEKEGVKFNPIPKEKIEQFIDQIANEVENQNSLFKIFLTFLSLFKNNNFDYDYLNEIEKKITTECSMDIENLSYVKNKELFFIDIIKDLYFIYEDFLKEQNCIDFSDMINKAIKDLKNYDKQYKYIIIDEYQDTSKIRCDLIKSLKDKNDNCKIMVVGDDWQSIYRFAGNDLNLFINFDKYLGAGLKLNIENTYRNSQELVDIASKFIMKNDLQIKKELKSFKKLNDNPVKAISYKEEPSIEIKYDKDGEQYQINRDTNLNKYFNLILEDIKQKNPSAKTIMLLGRYKSDIRFLSKELDFKKIEKKDANEKQKWEYKNSDFEFISMTIHGSKGLEADEVILFMNDKDALGFPSKIQDDEIMRFVLSKKESFPYAEERRLFYVATTRTRNRVYVLYNEQRPSEFISELINDQEIEILNKSNNDNQKNEYDIFSIEDLTEYLMARKPNGKPNEQVYVVKSIIEATKIATSRDNFISIMKEKGYDVDWRDNIKHVTFIGNKKRGNFENYRNRLQTLSKAYKIKELNKEKMIERFVFNCNQ